jgi:hypothetical protein
MVNIFSVDSPIKLTHTITLRLSGKCIAYLKLDDLEKLKDK